MKVGDMVRPLVIFDSRTVGVIIKGPEHANGAFGIQEGELYEVLINGNICFMFNFEMETLNETR